MRNRIGLVMLLGAVATIAGGIALVAWAGPESPLGNGPAVAIIALVGLLLIEIAVMFRGFGKPNASDFDL
jgi:hypothetical protein